MQRVLDIIFSLFAIVIFSPFLLTVAIALKVTGNKVFYRQERVGIGGKIFNILKFTTMVENSENMGTGTITLKNDTRVLPIGRFLRKSKLNELPQLFNVLIGEMSLIGPRPQDIKAFNAFEKEDQAIIIQVRSGLSGMGPIFFRDEDEMLERSSFQDKNKFYSEYIAPYKGKIESWYVKNRSLYLYFVLIFMTLYVVARPKNKINYFKMFKSFPLPPKIIADVLE